MDSNYDQILIGMSVLGRLFAGSDLEKADTIALVLMGKYDDALDAAFMHTHGEVGRGMSEELKEQYRKHLEMAINNETDKQREISQQEVCEKFMGNNEPHALGTVAELSEKYGLSKSAIRTHKREGTLEAFISERAD
jgi:hypothetical protein